MNHCQWQCAGYASEESGLIPRMGGLVEMRKAFAIAIVLGCAGAADAQDRNADICRSSYETRLYDAQASIVEWLTLRHQDPQTTVAPMDLYQYGREDVACDVYDAREAVSLVLGPTASEQMIRILCVGRSDVQRCVERYGTGEHRPRQTM